MDNKVHVESPIACDKSVLSQSQRERHLVVSRELFSGLKEIRELPNGYEFRFADQPNVLTGLVDFVALEKLCCPFLRFEIAVEAENGPVWLRLTGRDGVKEFIQEEIRGLIGLTGI